MCFSCGADWQSARRLCTGATGGLPTRRTQRVPLPTCPTALFGRILFHMGPFTLRVFALAASFAFAAPGQLKPTLKPADYGKWETLGQASLSPDGQWLAHEIRRTDKNDELRVAPAGGGKTHALAFCASPAFSADSRWLACEATVSEAEQDKLKKAKK